MSSKSLFPGQFPIDRDAFSGHLRRGVPTDTSRTTPDSSGPGTPLSTSLVQHHAGPHVFHSPNDQYHVGQFGSGHSRIHIPRPAPCRTTRVLLVFRQVKRRTVRVRALVHPHPSSAPCRTTRVLLVYRQVPRRTVRVRALAYPHPPSSTKPDHTCFTRLPTSNMYDSLGPGPRPVSSRGTSNPGRDRCGCRACTDTWSCRDSSADRSPGNCPPADDRHRRHAPSGPER